MASRSSSPGSSPGSSSGSPSGAPSPDGASAARASTAGTALLEDYSHAAVDEYNTRAFLLPILADPARRAELVAEHAANPLYAPTRPGEPPVVYSRPLQRLVDLLRVAPQKGKHVIVQERPWREYRIGILPGVRGAPVEVTDEAYPTRAEAEHAIFRKRLAALLEAYGIAS